MDKPKMLVHVCCAPDALYVLGVLKDNYEVSGYFYNPNIHPREEYDLRLKETKKVAEVLKVKLFENLYDDERWFKITQKFKEEPEKGQRCDVCYEMRLDKTAQKASQLGFDIFTSVMSLSPWKKADVLNRIGKMFAHRYKINFLEADFKKKDGFRKSIELSTQYGLYRQNYCGCLCSKDNKHENKK
jgi:predicted adenine nucleotide alpha hydrolase (AANH) superfamily ATPase